MPYPIHGIPAHRMIKHLRSRELMPTPWSIVGCILSLREGPAFELLASHGISDELAPPSPGGPGLMRQMADFQDLMTAAVGRKSDTDAAVMTPLHYLWAVTASNTSDAARILRERGITLEAIAAVVDTDADGPPADNPEREDLAEQMRAGKREQALRRHRSLVIPVNAIVAKDGKRAAIVQSITVFSHGMSVDLRVVGRRGADGKRMHTGPPDWSVEAKFDGAWIAGQRNSGHGNGDEWNEQVWLPIPPPKSFLLRVQGLNGSIEGSIELDGSGIVEAATRSEALWPEDEA